MSRLLLLLQLVVMAVIVESENVTEREAWSAIGKPTKSTDHVDCVAGVCEKEAKINNADMDPDCSSANEHDLFTSKYTCNSGEEKCVGMCCSTVDKVNV